MDKRFQWNNFILKFLFFIALLFVLVSPKNSLATATQTNQFKLAPANNPNIAIDNLTVKKVDKGNKITGYFRIYNLAPKYHGDLYYEISLIRIKNLKWDVNNSNNQLVIERTFNRYPIHLNQGLHKIFQYSLDLPQNIWDGTFLVKAKLYSGAGVLLSSQSVKISLVMAKGNFLEINYSSLSSKENNESNQYIFEPNDKIYFNIKTINSNTSNLSATAKITLRQGNNFGKILKEFTIKPFIIPSGEEIKKGIEIGTLKEGIYSISLQLFNPKGVADSNIVQHTFIIQGNKPLLTVADINPNKLSYQKNNRAKINIQINNLSDIKEGIKTKAKVKLTDESGQKIIGADEKDIFIRGNRAAFTAEIPVNTNLKKYEIFVSLVYNNQMIAQRKFQNVAIKNNNEVQALNIFGSSTAKQKSKIEMRDKYLIGALVLLILIITGWYFLRRKNNNHPKKNNQSKNNTVKMLSIILFFGLTIIFSMFFNANNAKAAGTLSICVYGKTYNSNVGFTNVGLSNVPVYITYYGSTFSVTTGSGGCFSASLGAGTYPAILTVKSLTRSINGVKYEFIGESKAKNVVIKDNQTSWINFYLSAKTGSVKFYTYNCMDNSAIGNATVHYESYTANTNNKGYYTLNGVYPGIYHNLYASKTNYSNSDMKNVAISSSETSHLNLCLKPGFGSLKGRVTTCSNHNQGISGANAYWQSGGLIAANVTDVNGYYRIDNLPAKTYPPIYFGGVSGYGNSAPQSITINPNSTTIANFCLNPNFNTLSYSWFPADGTNYVGFAGKLDYKFFINNTTLNSFNNVKVKFLFYQKDGTLLQSSSVTKNVIPLSTTEFDYTMFLPIIDVGTYKIAAELYYGGSLILRKERHINIQSLFGGWIKGSVTNCKNGNKISSATVTATGGNSFSGDTNNLGNYSIRLPLGDYSAYAYKTGYQNSVVKSFSINHDGQILPLDFCMNELKGSFNGKVTEDGTPIANAAIYWDDPSVGVNNVMLGHTDASGFFSIQGVTAGTYNGIYARMGAWASNKRTVVIHPNSTTVINFVLLPPASSPSGSLLYKSSTSNSITLSYNYSNGSNVSLFKGVSKIITFGSNSNSGSYTINGLSPSTSYNFYLRNGPNASSLLLDSVTASTKAAPTSYLDIGLRYYDGSKIVSIAVKQDLSSPLRIAKNGKIYSIVLVNVSDSHASKLRIKTSSGIKALRKL